MLVILLRLRDDPNSYPFLCGVYLEVQHRRAGSIRTPRPAFYDQENCNLSLYKSSRISLTNAILYCQSPVYLQQLKYKVTASRGRILNPSFNLPVNNSSSRSKRRLRVALMFTYAFLVIIEVESSFQKNKTSTEIYKNLLSCRRHFRLFVCFPLVILCLLFERARAEIKFTEILTRASSPMIAHAIIMLISVLKIFYFVTKLFAKNENKICYKLMLDPVTFPCYHSCCKSCLKRGFKAEDTKYWSCRTDLDAKYVEEYAFHFKVLSSQE